MACVKYIKKTKAYLELSPFLRRHAKAYSNNVTSFRRSPAGGLAAGSLAQLIASPTDLVKVQMQAEGRRVSQGKASRFTNCRQVYAMLYKESGILGFWRGEI